MIKLFVIDLDGCLAFPFQQPNWKAFEAINALNQASLSDEFIPPLSICTGRPHPYAECVAQLLSIHQPIIFESGGGMYNLKTNALSFHPLITEDVLARVQMMKTWMHSELIPQFPGAYPEFSKMTDCGLVHPEYSVINKMIELVHQKMDEFAMSQDFELHFTEVSINVILKACNKGAGLARLASELHLDLGREIAYIGDSGGDIPALERCAMGFAPQNATETVKALDHVSVLESVTTQSILDAYLQIINQNKQSIV